MNSEVCSINPCFVSTGPPYIIGILSIFNFSLYKKIYLNKKSYNFIIDCIKNYELYKKNTLNKSDDIIYPYNSYPKIKQVIYFFIKLNIFGKI